MTYQQRMELLSRCKPEYKDILLMKLIKGERIDITKDEDLFYQVNKDRVTLEQFVNRDKFKQQAHNVKLQKEYLHDPRTAKTKGGKFRWLGDIPDEVYFSRPEFSPLLPKEERLANIKKFLNTFPTFRAGDKRL